MYGFQQENSLKPYLKDMYGNDLYILIYPGTDFKFNCTQ